MGDSHVHLFRAVESSRTLSRTVIRTTIVGGATALGIVNPNSKTDALLTFRKQLRAISKRTFLLLLLGEVDCGFVIWYRAEKYGLSVESQFMKSLQNYEAFVQSLLSEGFYRIIICSAPLPTIVDGQCWGEVALARKDVQATQIERTRLTHAYNSSLEHMCNRLGLRMLRFDNDIRDDRSGLIRADFLSENPLDHHLNPASVAPLLAGKLRYMGFE